MEPTRDSLTICQLRIVLRGISPLIWRRILVRDDTTLAQLHDILQILFAWRDEHLHDFHIFGKDYGTSGADTRSVPLSQFHLRKGERFRYVYDYYAYWVCDVRLEAILPVDPKRFYPVCTGGKNASPSENFMDVHAYLEHIDQHRYNLPVQAMLVMADTLKLIVEADPNVPVREAIEDWDAIREACHEIEDYHQSESSRFHRRPINKRLRARTWHGDKVP